MTWFQAFDVIVVFALIIISFGYSALANFRYSFIHILLIIESIILALCLVIATASVKFDLIFGEIFIIFIIIMVAAETAVAISLYIKTIILSPKRYVKKNKKNKYKLLVEKNHDKANKKNARYYSKQNFIFVY